MILIKTLTGRGLSMPIPEQGPHIAALVEYVETHLGIPAMSQRVVYKGKVMPHDSDASLQDGDVVHIVVRLFCDPSRELLNRKGLEKADSDRFGAFFNPPDAEFLPGRIVVICQGQEGHAVLLRPRGVQCVLGQAGQLQTVAATGFAFCAVPRQAIALDLLAAMFHRPILPLKWQCLKCDSVDPTASPPKNPQGLEFAFSEFLSLAVEGRIDFAVSHCIRESSICWNRQLNRDYPKIAQRLVFDLLCAYRLGQSKLCVFPRDIFYIILGGVIDVIMIS